MNEKDKYFSEEAFKWLKENELGYDIWNNKYRFNNESFSQWLSRVSNDDEDIKRLIYERKFIFAGRTLANRNTNKGGSLSNCYSVGFVPDSLEGIMDVNAKLALTYKAQGGQGLSLSHVRPKGAPIGHLYPSDGIIPFMRMFNTTTEGLSQGGSRKGALMMSLDVWHKEAASFVTVKSNLQEITKANLSLEIDDEFMEDVKKGGVIKHIVREYSGHKIEYDVDVDKLWEFICEYSHKTAEPGILFTNRFRNYNLMEKIDDYQIETCNPCGEQPLIKHGSCNLSSINLFEYIKNPYTQQASFDYNSLFEDVFVIVRAMDDIIDENLDNHPLKEQKEKVQMYRNIGIGIMGLGSTFLALGMTYGGLESITFTRMLMKNLFKEAVLSSSILAKTRGSFPGYDKKVWDSEIISNAFSNSELMYLRKVNRLRNCSLLSIAPTGSIGTMFNVTTGVEPAFALSYTRKTVSLNNNQEKVYQVDIPEVEEYKKINNVTCLPDYFVTAHDIPWRQRLSIQKALQDSCDTAISSTVNLPRDIPVEEISDLYKDAWSLGLKGISIYREGSRDPILSTKITKAETYSKRPKCLKAEYFPVKVKGEQFAVLIGYLDNQPYEIFAIRPSIPVEQHMGEIIKKRKGVYTFKSDIVEFSNILETNINFEEKAATLYISMLLRHKISLYHIIKTAKKSNPWIISFTSAICRILSKFLDAETLQERCPMCGGKLIKEGGCIKCETGDYNRCGD